MRKIYLFIMAAFLSMGVAAQDVKVLIVHGGNTSDQHVASIIAAVDSANGMYVDTIAMSSAVFATKVADADAVIICETIGSGPAANYTGFITKPTICLKTYALLARKGTVGANWNWVDDKAETPTLQWFATHADNPANADVNAATEIEILEDHPIFNGLGSKGDVFSFASAVVVGQEAEAHYQTLDLSASTTNPDIAGASIALGRSTLAASNSESDLNDVLWAIEENPASKNSVVFAIHAKYILSPAGLKVITNSIKWMTGIIAGVKDIAASTKFAMYPNPIKDALTISNTSSVKSVEIVDISGRVVAHKENNGFSTIQINTSNLKNGLFLVRVNATEGRTYTNKLVK